MVAIDIGKVVLIVCYQSRSSESDNDHLAKLQAFPDIFAAAYPKMCLCFLQARNLLMLFFYVDE